MCLVLQFTCYGVSKDYEAKIIVIVALHANNIKYRGSLI